MKKTFLRVALICLLCGSMTMTSCIGSFNLTNKLVNWNKQIGDKFVNELVFFAFWIIPIYPVSALADILVLNSIEFWSGENPVVAKGSRIVEGNDGKYLVDCDGRGYTIKSLSDNSVVRFDFNTDDRSWSCTLPDGQTHTIFTFVDDTHVSLPAPDGTGTVVELSDAGLYAYQVLATPALFALK